MNQTQLASTSTPISSESFIALKTNEAKLYQNLKFIFADSTKVLAELMQNARRAGAKKISFSMEPESSTLVVEDDGVGISNFSDLLHNSKSGWDETIQDNENCFGIGFLSTLYAAETILVESRGQQCLLDGAQVIAMQPMKVTSSNYIGHTRLTLTKVTLSFSEIKTSLEKYAMGFSIPVVWNGEELKRPHAIDQLTDVQSLLIGQGVLRLKDMHSTAFYVQGLPIQSPLYKHTSNYEGINVVHLDPSFTVKMPDRHALYDSDNHVARIEEGIKQGWKDKLRSLKNTLPPNEFVEYYSTMKEYGELALLNDIDLLPSDIAYKFCEYPEDGSDRVITTRVSLTKDDIDSGRYKVVYNLSVGVEDHDGRSMLIQTSCYEHGWVCINGSPLDKDHWLYSTSAIDLDSAHVEVQTIGDAPIEAFFSGYSFQARVQIIDQLRICINEHELMISDPAMAVQNPGEYDVFTFYLGKTAYVGNVLRQANSYQDEYGSFMDHSFDEDEDALQNLRARLLGEAPSVSIEKALKFTNVHDAFNCKKSATVVAINGQNQINCDCLSTVLQQFAKHHALNINDEGIESFIQQVIIGTDVVIPERYIPVTKLTFEEFTETYKPINNPNPETQCMESGNGQFIGFETYGVDLEAVQKANPDCVWTFVDSDKGDEAVLVQGMRFVNRIHYVITERPCAKDVNIEVVN